jgi:hypothetical protein
MRSEADIHRVRAVAESGLCAFAVRRGRKQFGNFHLFFPYEEITYLFSAFSATLR